MVSAFFGYVGVLMALVFFGSNFVVVKKYDSGDGFFFQLLMCAGIWTVGLVVHLIQGSPKFYPFAMLGGSLWATGNVLCVYIIQEIGMGLGLVIWGGTALLVGWATGFFGLFGLKKDELTLVWLNVLGLVFALASLVTSLFVRSTKEKKATAAGTGNEFEALPGDPDEADRKMDNALSSVNNDEKECAYSSSAKSQLYGSLAAVCAGCFFGNNFDPPTYIQEHNCAPGNKCISQYRGASSQPLDYVFAHFCGIFTMSMAIFFGYCIFKRNKPWISSELCVPAYLSGCMWALGQVGWFIANGSLGYTVAFPLVNLCERVILQ